MKDQVFRTSLYFGFIWRHKSENILAHLGGFHSYRICRGGSHLPSVLWMSHVQVWHPHMTQPKHGFHDCILLISLSHMYNSVSNVSQVEWRHLPSFTLPETKIAHEPCMYGRWFSFFWGLAYFQGRTVSFRECKFGAGFDSTKNVEISDGGGTTIWTIRLGLQI